MPATEQNLQPISESQWFGMHSNPNIISPTGSVSLAINWYLKGSIWKMRPGLTQIDASLPATPANVIHFQELDGTLHTGAFTNGDWYEYDWSTGTWTQTDLSALSVTIDSSARIDCVVSRGRLVFTDGVNHPVMYDPSGPTWTVLTAAPIAGGVTMYYDRCFFYIEPDTLACTFEWSDETNPPTGYDGDNQSWDFAQTDNGAITAMVGLNNELPVFKQDSIAKLSGQEETDFQTDAVREGISETEGAAGRFGVVVDNGDAYYLSVNGPRCLRGGSQRVELDKDQNGDSMLEGVWSVFDPMEIGNAVGVLDKTRRHVIWLIPLAGETTRYYGLLYAIRENAFSIIDFSVLGEDIVSATNAEDPDGNEWVMFGCASGAVYLYGDETTDDAGSDFTARLRSRQYGRTLGIIQKRLVQVELGINTLTDDFKASMRPFRSDKAASLFARWSKGFVIPTATDNYQYRRQFNLIGSSVGWDFYVNEQDGRCEVLSATTYLTSSSNTSTRRG